MLKTSTPGAKFREAVATHKPLQVVGTVNAYAAKLAEHTGFRAVYVSGGGVAACSCGVPDLGITTLDDVLIDVRRITDATDLPMLVDIDTGWGHSLNVARAVRSMEKAGAAAIHIEDQDIAKRCGHRPGKEIVSKDQMTERVKAAVDARLDPDFVIMARTDAIAVEGVSAALDRAHACIEHGADMIFPEAVGDLATYKQFVDTLQVPILANITEFGMTPLLTRSELASVGVSLMLYPLSAFRAMSHAALSVYEAIARDGTQAGVIDRMQPRTELYEHLRYLEYERKLDELLAREH
ncbi:MAG: methylisocitrate lyase [Vicinamibacterales bacterium]